MVCGYESLSGYEHNFKFKFVSTTHFIFLHHILQTERKALHLLDTFVIKMPRMSLTCLFQLCGYSQRKCTQSEICVFLFSCYSSKMYLFVYCGS